MLPVSFITSCNFFPLSVTSELRGCSGWQPHPAQGFAHNCPNGPILADLALYLLLICCFLCPSQKDRLTQVASVSSSMKGFSHEQQDFCVGGRFHLK